MAQLQIHYTYTVHQHQISFTNLRNEEMCEHRREKVTYIASGTNSFMFLTMYMFMYCVYAVIHYEK